MKIRCRKCRHEFEPTTASAPEVSLGKNARGSLKRGANINAGGNTLVAAKRQMAKCPECNTRNMV